MDNRLTVIGITGVARSGKDTIARILTTRFGFTRIALADGVRSAFRDMDGPTWELTKDLEAAGNSTRWALQTLGTEAREDAADLFESDQVSMGWVYLVGFKIIYLHRYHPNRFHRFVIPDVRFPHECWALRRLVENAGGRYETWNAFRDGSGLSGEVARHPSETQVSGILGDIAILNNGTLDELETIVSTYAHQLLEE